jgi:hypothetical protein
MSEDENVKWRTTDEQKKFEDKLIKGNKGFKDFR